MLFSLVTELELVLKKILGRLVRLWLGLFSEAFTWQCNFHPYTTLFTLFLSWDTHVTHTIFELAELKIHKFWNTLIDIYKIRKQIQTNDSNTYLNNLILFLEFLTKTHVFIFFTFTFTRSTSLIASLRTFASSSGSTTI